MIIVSSSLGSECHEKACLSPSKTAAPAATVVMAKAFCQNDGAPWALALSSDCTLC